MGHSGGQAAPAPCRKREQKLKAELDSPVLTSGRLREERRLTGRTPQGRTQKAAKRKRKRKKGDPEETRKLVACCAQGERASEEF